VSRFLKEAKNNYNNDDRPVIKSNAIMVNILFLKTRWVKPHIVVF
jgi:hypothetical protein